MGLLIRGAACQTALMTVMVLKEFANSFQETGRGGTPPLRRFVLTSEKPHQRPR